MVLRPPLYAGVLAGNASGLQRRVFAYDGGRRPRLGLPAR